MGAAVLLRAALALVAFVYVAGQSFGYTASSDGKKWVINTGNGLTVTMLRSTCDIVSLLYKNQELQYKAKYTHINSGLGSVTSQIASTTVDGKNTIQITCSKTGITQYYFFRPNENAIYMGTYHASELALGELRFLARLDRATVKSGIPEATLDDTNRAIEATDVYATAANITRSKFFSAVPFIDDQIHGVYGPKAGVYLVMSDKAYETSIGGPFFKDINNQCTTANELSFYMNSDHTRTEDYRYGFHGPYALVFTDGAAPSSTSVVNFSFFQKTSLQGFIPDSQRGRVQGTINDPTGVLAGFNIVVGFKNAQAQYWTRVAAGGKLSYQSPLMKPGQYTVTVFKKQLAVATGNAVVSTGTTSTSDVTVAYTHTQTPLWTIGVWDGTPDGFLNADKIHKMHPSDARMSPFKPFTFTVGKNVAGDFPLALFRGVNDPLAISFQLTSQQASQSRTFNVGVTLAKSNARPTIRVNDKWNGPVLATYAVKTRGDTRGVTTGNYFLYSYTIPSSASVAGTNKIALGIASGNPDPPEPFLHASVVFDAFELL
ncbi:hypothetical protein AC1031_013463 [Aphanomyces cochlioides]|nr:hypothetical protein AC1031_013463 [Aphanomyces cochlioides]